MTFATIGASVKNGWRAGPSIFIGHALVELTIFLIILIGAAAFLEKEVFSYLAIIGGLVMLLFGLTMLRSAKETSAVDTAISTSSLNLSSDPVQTGIINSALNPFSGAVSAGIITSALNPFFVIWWLTAGSAIILQEYLTGILGVIAFILGHWVADLGFLVAVSISFSRGNDLFSQRTHEILVYICAGFMIFFGLWFMINNSNIATMT